MFLAAAIQMSAGHEREANERRAISLLDRACDAGARLVGLPEMWEHVGPAAEKREFAGKLDGAQLARVRELCARRSVWCLAGSIAEKAADGRVHNTAAVIAPDGRIAASYRKLHLFDVDIPDGARYRESEAVAPGQEPPPVVELTGLGVRLGLSVCYDLRFPELYRRLAEQGADIIAVPAAFTAYTGRAHWEVLLRARAIENQAYVLGVNRVGAAGDLPHSGGTALIDPLGVTLAGDIDGAVTHYRIAAGRTSSQPEQVYLLTQAARLSKPDVDNPPAASTER